MVGEGVAEKLRRVWDGIERRERCETVRYMPSAFGEWVGAIYDVVSLPGTMRAVHDVHDISHRLYRRVNFGR
jgi:hypothetical protein